MVLWVVWMGALGDCHCSAPHLQFDCLSVCSSLGWMDACIRPPPHTRMIIEAQSPFSSHQLTIPLPFLPYLLPAHTYITSVIDFTTRIVITHHHPSSPIITHYHPSSPIIISHHHPSSPIAGCLGVATPPRARSTEPQRPSQHSSSRSRNSNSNSRQ